MAEYKLKIPNFSMSISIIILLNFQIKSNLLPIIITVPTIILSNKYEVVTVLKV